MIKNILLVCLVLLLLIISFFALNAYIYKEKQDADNHNLEPYRAMLGGEYVCLPLLNENIPHTEECALGLKTDSGEYYAIDLTLMSQTPDPLSVGKRFTAAGMITPIERLNTDQWQKYGIRGIFSVTDSLVVEKEETEAIACNSDAFICPDGSAVGRQGPNCEFVTCPSSNATSAQITTYLGGTATALTVSIAPQQVISDSRCPAKVTCVWAGTVEVRTTLATPVSHGEQVFTLGVPQTFGSYTVTLLGVTPKKEELAIPDSAYRFTFEIIKS